MSAVEEQTVPNLIRTDEDMHRACILWRRARAAAEAKYGHIALWDTTAVTDMSGLFSNARDFNEDLSNWITSNVTSMRCTFFRARSFDCDISKWSVSKVTSMAYMFCQASSFTCDISGWQTNLMMSLGPPSNKHSMVGVYGTFLDCPVNFEAVWKERQWCQSKLDANWARRRAWMMVISPFLRRSGVTESPLQVVFDVQGLYQLITSFL